jgi:hypothetical protein
MNSQSALKARQLGIAEEIISCALDLISRNRNRVNAMDHGAEMDDYIYQAIIRQSIARRKQLAEDNLYADDPSVRMLAEKDLQVLSREELTTDPFYRAVLPLMIKVVGQQPILRLYAEESSAIVLELADFKRRHRAISFTEVIVRHCGEEIAAHGTN